MKVKVWMLLGLLFIMIVALPAANAVHAIEVTATISVGTTSGGHYGIAYDSGKGEIFVTHSESNTVSVISDSSLPPVPEFTPAAFLILATATCIIAVAFRKKLLPIIYKGP
jgi:hypothetical protein